MRPTTLTRLAVPALAAVLLVGCGLRPESGPQLLDAADIPQGAQATASPAETGRQRVLVYLVHDGVLVAVSRAAPTTNPADVVQALLAGPNRREQDAGLVTAVSAAEVEGTARAGVVTVHVPAPDASSSGRNDEVLSFGQLVLTLTSVRGVTAVRFTRDGEPLSVPRSDGSLSNGPLTRRDYAELL